jgi:hypothetical protein
VWAFLLTAWYGGSGPAFLNLLLAPVALAFFVLDPPLDIGVESPVDRFGLVLYCATSLVLLLYSQTGRVIRGMVQSSLEQSPLQEMPRRITEIETQLTDHVAQSEVANRRLTAQFRVVQVLASSASIEEAARPILQAICEGTGWEVGLFWLADGHADNLHCFESWGLPTDRAQEFQRASKQYASLKGKGFPRRVWDADSVVEAYGKAVHDPLVLAWWNDQGFAGKCPRCGGWIHFTIRGKKAIKPAEAAQILRLPDDWHVVATIL